MVEKKLPKLTTTAFRVIKTAYIAIGYGEIAVQNHRENRRELR